MNVFVTGASGFVGTHIVRALIARGDSVTGWTRSPERAARTHSDVSWVGLDDDDATRSALAGADAVINLAGAPIVGRWTEAKRKALFDSRVRLTERLVAAMPAEPRPRVLVSASAVGRYEPSGAREITEQSPTGDGFLGKLCASWEAAAQAASPASRVAILRLGVVLGPDGGALDQMLTPFKAGVGGKLGPGTQYMPWVHIDDVVAMFLAACDHDVWRGAYNVSAPTPVTNEVFTKTLASVLRRPALVPVPTFGLKLAMGESAAILLDSLRVLPERAVAQGFTFAHTELEAALRDVLDA